MTPREFEDILMLVVAIIGIVLLILVSYKIFTSSKKIIIKIVLFLLTLFLFLPFWYLVQFVTYYSLARIIPNNQIISCFLLSEKNCKKRPDCRLIYLEGGLGKAEPECISIPDQHRKSNN